MVTSRHLLQAGTDLGQAAVRPVPQGRRSSGIGVLASRPGFGLVGVVRVPHQVSSPLAAIARRIGYAVAALTATVLVVYSGREGYTDSHDGQLSLLDCVYYATVSLSTTGYGDIAPATPTARLVNIFVVTPLRVSFLIVLVGTTLAVLTEDSRQSLRIRCWRRRVRGHTVVVGYGTKGRAAVEAMLEEGARRSSIVVIDTAPEAVEAAAGRGVVTVRGSGTASETLQLAVVSRSAAVVVAVGRDDTAVLSTLTARHLAPAVRIAVAVRQSENSELVRRCGAEVVVVSSQTTGRLMGVATGAPRVVELIEDLLSPEDGFAVAQRPAEPHEIGLTPRELPDIVLGIVREGQRLRTATRQPPAVAVGDELLYIHRVTTQQ
ncbi:potassium channel family protein [Nocardia asteroides]|nr:potassium channel family protein [Nocardia asteroides]